MIIAASLLISAALASAAPARFSLIITYNGSLASDRPPLHYADDDGAKYHEVLGALGEPGGTLLLTEFDQDSRKLFPDLAASTPAPTHANVALAADALARKVAAAKSQGRPTELTFVYAGHGDVDKGRGYLVLQDGHFDGDALEALLEKIGADTSHVILDSCNSFFVLSPRGPGRRFATPQDVAERLSHELSNVGLFLSTNAEAEVYEWSELQSGVFSHAVRSGLLGAADANGDGVVTYEELAAFVDRSTRSIANPLFRPKLFARGPGGKNDAPLADLRGLPLAKLRIDDPKPVRLSVRDRDGLRWIDVHSEGGAPVELRLPPRLAGAFVERTIDGVAHELALPDAAGQEVVLAALTPTGAAPESRGADAFLRMLFAQPFGPQAYQEYEHDKQSEATPAFGISATEKQRLDLVLHEVAQTGKKQREASAVALFSSGAALMAAGSFVLSQPTSGVWIDYNAGYVAGSLVGGALLAVEGGFVLGVKSEQEKVLGRYVDDLKRTDQPPGTAEEAADQALAKLDAQIETWRRLQIVTEWICAGLGGTLVVITAVEPQPSPLDPSYQSFNAIRAVELMAGVSATVAGVGGALVTMLTDDPTRKLIHLWQQDPDHLEITGIGVTPTDHGAVVGLSGRF